MGNAPPARVVGQFEIRPAFRLDRAEIRWHALPMTIILTWRSRWLLE